MTIVLITFVHVLVCIFLIIVVLLQSGKSADIAGTFGGMGSQTAFGPRGAATVLSKATTTSAILFMVTSISLVWLSSRHSTHSVLTGAPVKSQSQPAAIPVPATTAPAPPASGPPAAQPTPPPASGAPGPAQPNPAKTPAAAPQTNPK